MTASPNPIATEHLPFFVTAPGQTDVLFNITMVFVIAVIVLTGVVFLTIHSLPERMAHKSKKLQFDVVAVLCLLALFTHEHVYWIAALLLAFIDIPDFLTPVKRIAASVETIAGQEGADSPEASETVIVEGGQPAAELTSSASKIGSSEGVRPGQKGAVRA
jgi:hypothetical protein